MHGSISVFPHTSIWRRSCAYTLELEHFINTQQKFELRYVSEILCYRIKLLLLRLCFLLAL